MGGPGAANFGWNGAWNDSAFDLYLESALQNIAHTSSTAVFEFFASGGGWQGGFDESWGIDNIEVSIDATAVPMPGASAMGAAGLLAAAARRRRR
jgi:MYXO-CTERM domain-containing protein